MTARATPPRYRALVRSDIDRIDQLQRLAPSEREAMKAVSAVLPFRVNEYIVNELIRWDDVPDDPIYQLTFPQPGMLDAKDLDRMLDLVRRDAPATTLQAAAREIQT
ncbi:MAG: lysine 2,3-aminomutase, partial [Deltaproteobacteria bacterium]|nr:lysine 2,3-aminomutase [Deltaproteobacteria bacterium]